jgi:hypothetical protein
MISLIVTAKPYKTERIMTDGDVLTVPRRKAATEIKTAQNKAKVFIHLPLIRRAEEWRDVASRGVRRPGGR